MNFLLIWLNILDLRKWSYTNPKYGANKLLSQTALTWVVNLTRVEREELHVPKTYSPVCEKI